MKNLHFKNLVFTGLILIFFGICSQGYSQNKSDGSLPGGATKLKYQYPSDKAISYLNISKIIQFMDIEGQSMQVNVNSVFGCSVKNIGTQEKNLKLEIQIDTLSQLVDSPQGIAGGSIKEIQGKVFNMILTPEGKETDISEASKIVFNMEGSGETNASQTFLDFFPDLPTGNVKPGDTWNSTDTVSGKTPTMSRLMVQNSVNKFEGIEKINEIDCAKISSKLSGTMYMTTQTQGMDIVTNGPFTGSGTLFFAIKEGYFVRQTVTSRMTGTIDITGPQSMTFPLVMDITSVNEVKK